jgi:ABC-2 type transport system permease protein
MPLWVLSGAVFPTTGAAKWMQWIMNANPLGYGVTALRTLFSDTGTSNDPSVLLCFIVLTFFSVLVLGATFYQVSRPSVRYFN